MSIRAPIISRYIPGFSLACLLVLIAAPQLSRASAKLATAQQIQQFRAVSREKARAAEKAYNITVAGKDGWLFFGSELRHVGAGKFWGAEALRVSQSAFAKNADPIPAILDFEQQLDRAGIELLMVPVPAKAIVHADMLWPNAADKNSVLRFDAAHQEFYSLLRENGVQVLDLTPNFIAARNDAQGPIYCRQDTHWSGRATVLAARSITRAISEKSWLGSVTKRSYSQSWKRVRITGDLWEGLGNVSLPKESLRLRFVGTPLKNKTGQKASTQYSALQAVPIDLNSPVLLLGDSHTLVFHEGGDMHARGAGLPDQLALELGFPIDLIGVRGSGATPARTTLMRRAKSNSNYLKNKKFVIWCFSAREFTETSGWQKVPIIP